jgi:hypothetical protein
MNQFDYSPAVLALDNFSYKEREYTAPALESGAVLIFDEPGRILNNVCYRSFYFRVAKQEYGPYALFVKHGAGTESWRMQYTKAVIDGLAKLDSDSRYLILHTLMRAHQESERQAVEKRDAFWRQAAAEKRIKTRKVKAGIKVWIEEKACKVA